MDIINAGELIDLSVFFPVLLSIHAYLCPSVKRCSQQTYILNSHSLISQIKFNSVIEL